MGLNDFRYKLNSESSDADIQQSNENKISDYRESVRAYEQQKAEAQRAAAEQRLYQINKENWSLNNQQMSKDFSYAQQNKAYQESQNIAKIKATAAAQQAQIEAAQQASIAALRSVSSASVAGVNARDSMLNPQFKQDKFNEINPRILESINGARQNYGMYNALGGDKPVTRSALGLAEQMHTGAQIADINNTVNNTYSSLLNRSAGKIADKYQSQGYGSDSPILSGLLDSQAGLSRTMQEGTNQKNYTDTKTNNQQYGLDSNQAILQRQSTLADLKSNTQQGNSSLLGLLTKGL